MRIGLITLCLFLLFSGTKAQEVYTLQEYLEQLEENHPVAKTAGLRIDQMASKVLAGKGIFDPTLTYNQDKKTLDGTSYYNHSNPELKVLTPVGIKVKAGIENNTGKYLNPELTNGVMSYAGVEIPVLKGLLIDEQRVVLQMARIMESQSEVERRAALNRLYEQAIETYVDWAGYYLVLGQLRDNFLRAQEYFSLTKNLFENGDKSAADTTEAYSQVLAMRVQLAETQMNFQKAGVELSYYLWNEQGSPYLINPAWIPQTYFFERLPALTPSEELSRALSLHPEVLVYDFKLQGYTLERKLNFQSMLPELTLKANVLSKDYYRFESAVNPYLGNNNKFGLSFKAPLFMREGRGKYQYAELKIQETEWERRQKRWMLNSKIMSLQQKLTGLQNQIQLSEDLVISYQRMLDFETMKFQQGDASLFVINSRQNKLIESLIKLQKTKTDYLKTWYKQQAESGLLYQ